MVGMSKINSSVKVEILRNKQTFTKLVRIEELPTEENIAIMQQQKINKTQISGITISNINEGIKRDLNIYGGVKVDSVTA